MKGEETKEERMKERRENEEERATCANESRQDQRLGSWLWGCMKKEERKEKDAGKGRWRKSRRDGRKKIKSTIAQ
jgi:hypothetical protein